MLRICTLESSKDFYGVRKLQGKKLCEAGIYVPQVKKKNKQKKPITFGFENVINFRKIWPWPLHPRKFPKLQNGHLLSKNHTANSPTPQQSCSLHREMSSDKPY